MNEQIPKLITDYIALKIAHDTKGLLNLFNDDAEVTDAGENKVMSGRDEIRAWLDETVAKYNLVNEIVDYSRDGSAHIIQVKTSGDFTGSPVMFSHTIELQDDLINSLSIEYIGAA